MGYQHLEEQHFMLAQKVTFTIFLITEKKFIDNETLTTCN